jgi:hypothetical protein
MNINLLWLLLPLAVLAQEDPWADDSWGDEEKTSTWSGFVEAGFGTRFDADSLIGESNTLEDLRWRLESRWQPGAATLSLKADAAYDGIDNEWLVDVRDLTFAFAIGSGVDVKLGRQVQTWGTGDLVFLNDLFPKDFVSFFSGRDDEYLKAPGNSLRITRYSPVVNIDFAWTPVFEPDVYLTGERYAFFSPLAGGNIAPDPQLSAIEPGESFANGEFALRLFRTVAGHEYAIYAYRGYFKQPNAMTPSFEATFAPLTSVGASLRRPVGPGLFNTELAYYASRDDRDGSNPLLPNDQLRILLGYEWEAKPNFTIGLQYYIERTLDYDALIANSPFPQYEPDEYRHLLTNRLTYRAGRDKYTWSMFTFYSPTDSDFYLRPVFTYRHNDAWSLTAGASLFGGDEPHTFFSQLQDASNAYLRIKYSY